MLLNEATISDIMDELKNRPLQFILFAAELRKDGKILVGTSDDIDNPKSFLEFGYNILDKIAKE